METSKETETLSLIDAWFDLTDGWYFNAPVGIIPMKAEAVNSTGGIIEFFYWLIPTIKEGKLSFAVFTKKDDADRRFVENCKKKITEFSRIQISEFLRQNKEYIYRSAKFYKDVEDFGKKMSNTDREESYIFEAELSEEEQVKFIQFIEHISN